MSDLMILDGSQVAKYVKFAAGDGSESSPYTSYGAGILTALQAIETAVEGTLAVNAAALTLTTVTGTVAASGDTTLIVAPAAGNRLVIASLLIQNESTSATVVLLKSGSTVKRRALLQNQGDALGYLFPPGREWRLGAAEALVVNLSAANSHSYTIDYLTESV